MTKLESKLQTDILALNHRPDTNYYSVKVSKANVWGFPDLITFLPDGEVLLIELKASKGLRLGIRQLAFSQRISSFNKVHRIWSVDGFFKLVKGDVK